MHLETQTLKIYPLGANHDGAFMGSMYVTIRKNSIYVTGALCGFSEYQQLSGGKALHWELLRLTFQVTMNTRPGLRN